MFTLRKSHIAAMFISLAVYGANASAAIVTYSALDPGVGPATAHPLSAAAAASFDAAASALGKQSIITFESAPLGSFASLTVAPGVSISGTSEAGTNQAILNAPNLGALDGFNTTAGGSQFVEVSGGTLTFTFATPVQYFGAYFSGVQNFFSDFITFSDGSTQSVSVPTGSQATGGLAFAGFTDAGKAISSITVNVGNAASGYDDIGVDDVRYQVPEPMSAGMLAIGGGAFLLRRRRGCVGV